MVFTLKSIGFDKNQVDAILLIFRKNKLLNSLVNIQYFQTINWKFKISEKKIVVIANYLFYVLYVQREQDLVFRTNALRCLLIQVDNSTAKLLLFIAI